MGREPLVEAAADLLVAPGVADLMGGVIGVRRVAEAARVAPATINHHFRSSGGGRNERLVIAGLRHALARTDFETSRQVAAAAGEALAMLRAGDPEALRRLVLVAADDVLAWSPDTEAEEETDAGRIRRSTNNALQLGAVAAASSTEARRMMLDHYARLTEIWSTLYGEMLDATDRRLIGDLQVRDLTTIISALADGFILRRSFDPDTARPELFGEATLRLFEALSSPRAAAEDRDPADALMPLPSGSQLDGHKRIAMASAAGTVYKRKGWEGLTVSAVVAESGVSRRTVLSHFGDRSGLAAAVWSRFVPSLAASLERDHDLPPVRRIVRHLERLAGTVRSHRPLSAALLERMLSHSVGPLASRSSDPTDPEALVPLAPMLRSTIEAGAPAFRPGHAGDASQALETARHLTTSTMSLACMRPTMTDSGVADYVADTTLAGMLIRRPTRRG